MQVNRYRPPDIAYGHLPEYVGAGRPFKLRPGQLLTATPRLAVVTDQTYLDYGITNLLISSGYDAPELNFARTGTCLANEYLRGFLPDKPLEFWDQFECFNAVDNLFNARGGGWGHTSGQMFEAYGINVPWQVINGSIQQQWIDGRIQERLDQVGGVYCGEYNGSTRIYYDQVGPDYFRRPLIEGGETALRTMLDFPAFGDGFYTKEAWRWRHGSINAYYLGETDVHKFINERLVTLEMDRLTKQHLGTNRSTTVFGWSGKYQPITPTAFSVEYARQITGGTFFSGSFPSWTCGAQIGMYFMNLADNYHFFSWEDALRFGTNPNVVTNEQNGFMHYEGEGAERSPVAFKYTPDRVVAYPITPEGGQDLVLVSADMLWQAAQHCGFNSIWTSHRRNDGNFSNANARDYLTDRYTNYDGYCKLGGSAKYRWLFYMNTGLSAGNWETVEARMLPGYLSFEAEGSTPHLFFITL